MKKNKANNRKGTLNKVLRLEFNLVKRTRKGYLKSVLPWSTRSKIENLIISNPERKWSQSWWDIQELGSYVKYYMWMKGYCQLQAVNWIVGAFYLEVSVYTQSTSCQVNKHILNWIYFPNYAQAFGALITVSRDSEPWRYILSKGVYNGHLSLDELSILIASRKESLIMKEV